MKYLKIIMAQLDFLVGDIAGNARKIIQAIKQVQDTQADLIIFPELALSGYPPEDLLDRPDLHAQIQAALIQILPESVDISILFGVPYKIEERIFNSALLMEAGNLTQVYHKQKLPNYQIFDEMRYFSSGDQTCVVDIKGIKIGITICEDLWFSSPILDAKAAGAELVLSINASPFATNKAEIRRQMIGQQARDAKLPVVYVNSVGAQDELIFDGGSMIFDASGNVVYQADYFKEHLYPVEIQIDHQNMSILNPLLIASDSKESHIYSALVLGIRDYVHKNKFRQAIIGLSGGIDSALTLAIAVDALGKENVMAVMMPSRYTSDLSLEAAKAQALKSGVEYHILSIEPVFLTYLETLKPLFEGMEIDTTEENLQARCRGTLLMALSNKKNAIVLSTGNKSEIAVGYATLYGDMAGGFCVLKDVFKTWVYRLAHWRNAQSAVIPEAVIRRAPSAELAENQIDEDSLPPYDILDQVLERYIEQDQSLKQIIDAGFDTVMVKKIVKMIDRNEYKRRQSAPGVRITERAFGKDRRYPITSGFKIDEL